MDGDEAPGTDGTDFVPSSAGAVSGSVAGPVGVVVGSLADAVTELSALVRVPDVALGDDWSGEDLLERAKENRLQRLGVVRRLESELAAVKALTIAEYVGIEGALTPPDLGRSQQRAREVSLIAEIGGILGLGAGQRRTWWVPAINSPPPSRSPSRHWPPGRSRISTPGSSRTNAMACPMPGPGPSKPTSSPPRARIPACCPIGTPGPVGCG